MKSIMGTHGVIMFYEKCRLCLTRPGATNVFQTEGLKQDIFDCTGVTISSAESLPEKICTECLDIVKKAKELRILAMKNDTYLKDLFCDEDTFELPSENDQAPENDPSTTLNEQSENQPSTTLNEQSENRAFASVNEVRSLNNDTVRKQSPESTTIQVRKDLFRPSVTSSPIIVVKKAESSTHKKSKHKTKSDTHVVENMCTICNKKFETHKKWYLHTRQHEKKYGCPIDVCGKKFATKGDLEKHLRTHTGVKPYGCEICDKSFTQMGTLKAHLENVHYCYSHVK